VVVVLAEITAAISGAKGAVDLVKGIASLSTEYGIQERTIELQVKILSLISQLVEIQTRFSDLTQENADIRKEMAEMVDWRRDVVPKYELVQLAKGVFAYHLRELPGDGENNTEPEHYLCYGCFEKSRKAILQFSGYNGIGAILTCNECGVSIINHADKSPSPGPLRVSRSSRFDAFT
jgi:hypothetical protein